MIALAPGFLALGPHAAFIVLAYAFVALVVALLVIWVIADHRRQQSDLRALEQQGVRRRSAKESDTQ